MDNALSQYKQELADLIGTIKFYSTTLKAAELVATYDKSSVDHPNTMVNIISTKLATNYMESRMNKRLYTITIAVKCYAPDRMETAQLDLDYLEEQIMTILENNLTTVAWGDGYLNNDQIVSMPKNYNDSYFTKLIQFDIAKRVDVINQ